jgi:hypothetical protein
MIEPIWNALIVGSLFLIRRSSLKLFVTLFTLVLELLVATTEELAAGVLAAALASSERAAPAAIACLPTSLPVPDVGATEP